jgi:hypothetical protein
MFTPKTPEEIKQIIDSVIIRELHDQYVPDFFLDKAQPLIQEAAEWQKQHLDKSALGNFRIDQKAKHLAQRLMDSEQGKRYQLSDENLERVKLLEDAISLCTKLDAKPSDKELCEQFDFTPDELTALRAIQAFKRKDARAYHFLRQNSNNPSKPQPTA